MQLLHHLLILIRASVSSRKYKQVYFFLDKCFLIAHALASSIKFIAIQVAKKSKLLYPLHMMTDVLPTSLWASAFLLFLWFLWE